MSDSKVYHVTVDHIKEYLKSYSKFLRRDFLGLLVKMASKELGIRTVREDWRTRKGMYSYLLNVWEKLHPLFHGNTVFKWYATHFERNEKIFSNRKFIIFVFVNWKTFGSFVSDPKAMSFFESHHLDIEGVLEGGILKTTPQWVQDPIGCQWSQLLMTFQSSPATSKAVEQPKEPSQSDSDTVSIANSPPDYHNENVVYGDNIYETDYYTYHDPIILDVIDPVQMEETSFTDINRFGENFMNYDINLL